MFGAVSHHSNLPCLIQQKKSENDTSRCTLTPKDTDANTTLTGMNGTIDGWSPRIRCRCPTWARKRPGRAPTTTFLIQEVTVRWCSILPVYFVPYFGLRSAVSTMITRSSWMTTVHWFRPTNVYVTQICVLTCTTRDKDINGSLFQLQSQSSMSSSWLTTVQMLPYHNFFGVLPP